MPTPPSSHLPAHDAPAAANELEGDDDLTRIRQIHKRIEKFMSQYEEEPEKDTTIDDMYRRAKIEETWGKAGIDDAADAHDWAGGSVADASIATTAAGNNARGNQNPSPAKKRSAKAKQQKGPADAQSDHDAWLTWFNKRADERQELVDELMGTGHMQREANVRGIDDALEEDHAPVFDNSTRGDSRAASRVTFEP